MRLVKVSGYFEQIIERQITAFVQIETKSLKSLTSSSSLQSLIFRRHLPEGLKTFFMRIHIISDRLILSKLFPPKALIFNTSPKVFCH